MSEIQNSSSFTISFSYHFSLTFFFAFLLCIHYQSFTRHPPAAMVPPPPYVQLLEGNEVFMRETSEDLDGLQVLPDKQGAVRWHFLAWLLRFDPGLKKLRKAKARDLAWLAKRYVHSSHAGRRFWWGVNRRKWLRDLPEEVEDDSVEELLWSWPRDEDNLVHVWIEVLA